MSDNSEASTEIVGQQKKYTVWDDRKDFYFDPIAAFNAVKFFETELVHVKGPKAGQRLTLERWQRRFIRRLYGWKRKDDHSRRYRTAFIFVPRKNGKALALSTPIATPNGWTTMGELRVGDDVYDERGSPTRIVAATEVMFDRPCFEIAFSDGERIVCDAQHQWQVDCRGKEKTCILTTQEMYKERIRVANGLNFSIPVAPAIQYVKKPLAVDPYLLGLWLGDGNTNTPIITCSPTDYDEIKKHIHLPYKVRVTQIGTLLLAFTGPVGGDRATRVLRNGKSLLDLLRDLNVIGNKHIPIDYLQSDYEDRLSLLQGLMDSDGYCSRNGQCEFTTTLLHVADNMLALLRSMGFKPTMIQSRATLYGKDCGPKYRIFFFAYQDTPVFRLPRKLCNQKKRKNNNKIPRSARRHIVSITPVGSVPVRCIQVESKSHLFLAGRHLVPTHNSFLGAGIALYGLVADGEVGAECVSAAVDREQARVIFDVAKQIVALNPKLSRHITQYSKTLVVHRTASKYSVLSADVENKHGSNPSTIVFDELHTQPNGDLVSVLKTGTGARRQPLTVFFTTAGHDQNTVCYEYYLKAKQIQAEPWRDPTFLPLIYEATKEDDWKDEATWRKANPNYGISINPINFRQAFNDALENKRLENDFKRLYLNMWTEQLERWLPMDQWDAGAIPMFTEGETKELLCIGGLDLSSKIDVTAFVLLFVGDDGTVFVRPYFWLPEEGIIDKEERDSVPYRQWAKDGYIQLTPGNIIDYAYIRKYINKIADAISIREIAFDPYRAEQIAVQLGQDGFMMVEVRQGFPKLSEPSKELEALLASKKIKHNGHPVLRWMAQNAASETNAYGDIMPSKRRAKHRMDGIAALVTALSRVIVYAGSRESKYEDEGLSSL